MDTQLPEDQLRIDVARTGQSITVTLVGELDLATAPFLRQTLADAENVSGPEVILDLRDLKFIDSVGLYILLNAQRRLRRQSRTLAVICGPGAVRRTIELTRLTATLGVVSSFEEYQGRRPAA